MDKERQRYRKDPAHSFVCVATLEQGTKAGVSSPVTPNARHLIKRSAVKCGLRVRKWHLVGLVDGQVLGPGKKLMQAFPSKPANNRAVRIQDDVRTANELCGTRERFLY